MIKRWLILKVQKVVFLLAFLVKLEFGNVGLLHEEGRKLTYPNQQQTNPPMASTPGFEPEQVEGECSHHALPLPPYEVMSPHYIGYVVGWCLCVPFYRIGSSIFQNQLALTIFRSLEQNQVPMKSMVQDITKKGTATEKPEDDFALAQLF